MIIINNIYKSYEEILDFYLSCNLEELINIRNYLFDVRGYLSGEGEESGVLQGIQMVFELINISSEHVGDFFEKSDDINKFRNYDFYPYININEIIIDRLK